MILRRKRRMRCLWGKERGCVCWTQRIRSGCGWRPCQEMRGTFLDPAVPLATIPVSCVDLAMTIHLALMKHCLHFSLNNAKGTMCFHSLAKLAFPPWILLNQSGSNFNTCMILLGSAPSVVQQQCVAMVCAHQVWHVLDTESGWHAQKLAPFLDIVDHFVGVLAMELAMWSLTTCLYSISCAICVGGRGRDGGYFPKLVLGD